MTPTSYDSTSHATPASSIILQSSLLTGSRSIRAGIASCARIVVSIFYFPFRLVNGQVLLFGDTGQLLHKLDHDGKVHIHPGRNLHPSGAGPPIGTASRMMRSISCSVAWLRWISPAGAVCSSCPEVCAPTMATSIAG